MPVIDDYRFAVSCLLEKVKRSEAAAKRVEADPTSKNKALLRVMCARIDDWYDEFHTNIAKISQINKKNNTDEDLEPQIIAFEGSYYETKAVYEVVTIPDAASHNPNVSTGQLVVQTEAACGIQLPKLKLPEFGGNRKEWQSFSELFNASVHRNDKISDVQRHAYLRAALQGEALALVSSLPLTGPNYVVAWDTLVRHYDSTHLQTNMHLDAIYTLPMTSASPSSLRSFATQLAEAVGALGALGHEVESWAVPILYICCRRLHNKLREEWETLVLSQPSPTIKEFIEFIHDRARVLEAVHPSGDPKTSGKTVTSPNKTHRSERGITALVVEGQACPRCSSPHALETCGHFRKDDRQARFNLVREHNLCLACLGPGHFAQNCSKRKSCKHCYGRHHTLFHRNSNSTDPEARPIESGTTESSQTESSSEESASDPVSSLQVMAPTKGQVVVATAIGQVLDWQGRYQDVRILIDSGSQGSFISRRCLSRLGLDTSSAEVPVLGMGQTALGMCREKVVCQFRPEMGVDLTLEALVVGFIARAPASPLPQIAADRINGKKLADPLYYQPQEIDVLLGAEWFGCVMIGSPELGPPGTPCLIESIWGYCLIGRCGQAEAAVRSFHVLVEEEEDWCKILQRFWEIEEAPVSDHAKPEDIECEEFYKQSVSRDPDGRFVVALPFLKEHAPLGNSRHAALRRLVALERRLGQNPVVREKYNAFMEDYITQGHMQLVIDRPVPDQHYYIPHHSIYKCGSGGEVQKFRVVFDSSMKTTNGPSLNQILHKGPKLQADIVDILVRARLFPILVITDIRQMYRNIKMRAEDQEFQRILWRFRPELPIQEFKLTTVTYGVSASPFLAIRTLRALCDADGASYPMAAAALRGDTYMDDVVKSMSSVEEALKLQGELIALASKAGFELRKWMSNSSEVLNVVPAEHRMLEDQAFESESDVSTKILGLVWKPKLDVFSYKISGASPDITKRKISSDIGKLYDPLGFLSPVIFVGKLLLRQLWEKALDWDEPPSIEVKECWQQFRSELPVLEAIAITRCVEFHNAESHQIHGFADSSEKGYAGVVYLRSQFADGSVKLSLLMAKSKVAPLKTCSLPRLELCGIELVTRLIERVILLVKPFGGVSSTTVWSDSMVALYWVRGPPHKWKTFVANRVSIIQSRVEPLAFRHVPTEMNPADCASRGLFPSEILTHDMWLTGPSWLLRDSSTWPENKLESPSAGLEVPESRTIALTTQIQTESTPDDLQWIFARFSSLSSLTRVVAWCRRFVHNRFLVPCQGKTPLTGRLSHSEVNEALASCIKMVQRKAFAKDLKRMQKGKPAYLPLRRLAPILDKRGIIRVGGRLRHAHIPEAQKFPIILPKTHGFTTMVIDHYHRIHLHIGKTALRSIIGRNYWILSMQSAIHARISKCVVCFKAEPKAMEPLMGDLPYQRVQAGKPFSVTGVDYGGPYEITMGRIRKAKILKAYICLFVCFKTKAVHLELASDLTTDAFLAALKRFIARRGSVSTIFSDQGTNFVGARRRMESWAAVTHSVEYHEEASRYASARNIEWKHIPASTPHMGGIWEAGIKSTKRLLAKSMGQQLLTYEEFYTVLTQVESALNSRPLTPMSTDPNDLQALTPAHFLFSEPPTSLNEPEHGHSNLRDRWALVTQLSRSFWKRWSADYLNTLQQRNKWTTPAPDIEVGMLVLIKEENSAPFSWKLGRIRAIHPGRDGIGRSAEIQTSHGIITRGTVKLCPLPIA